MDLNSTHGGTFSEGVPNFEFKKNLDDFSKCPNCEGDNFKGDFCFDCNYGYSKKEKIFLIIEPKNLMTPEEIGLERKFLKESRGKERRNW